MQSQPTSVQPANPNVTSITAGNVTDTALTAGGCVQASGTGLLSVTGISCGSGGGGSAGGGTINNASQYSSSYYSYTGSSNVISGLAAGTAGQYLTTQGSSGPPTWTTFVSTITASSLGALTSTAAATTYLTQTAAAGTYETISGAAGTYLPLSGGTLTGILNGTTINDTGGYFQNGLPILSSLSGSSGNTAVGADALDFSPTGTQNTAVGVYSELETTTGGNNTATGYSSLYMNSSGGLNDAYGVNALFSNSTGSQNDGFGWNALEANTSGSNNDGFGISACAANTIGTNNLCLGAESNVGANNLTNAIAIGANATVNASNTMQLGGTGTNAVTVNTSSANFSGAVQIAASGSLQMQNLAGNQCVQTTGDGHITTAGFACGSAGGNPILNQNTLQSGATFYVSSGTVGSPAGKTIGTPVAGALFNVFGPGINMIQSTNFNNPAFELFMNGHNFSQVSAPLFGTPYHSGWMFGTNTGIADDAVGGLGITMLSTAAVVFFDTGGTSSKYVGFRSTTTNSANTIWNLPPGDSAGVWQSDGNSNLSVSNTISASSLTITNSGGLGVAGTGNGKVTLTISGSTYTVTSSSIVPTVGNVAVYTSSNGTLGNGSNGTLNNLALTGILTQSNAVNTPNSGSNIGASFMEGQSSTSTGVNFAYAVEANAFNTEASSGSLGYLYGGEFLTTNYSTNTWLTSAAIYAQATNNSTGTVTNSYGVYGVSSNQGGGIITSSYDSYFQDTQLGGSTETIRYGSYIDNPSLSGGSVLKTNYGLYIATQTAGTTNWGVFAPDSLNLFDTITLQTVSTAGGSLTFNNSGGNNHQIIFQTDTGASMGYIYFLTNTEAIIDDDTTGPLYLQTGDTTRLGISYAGTTQITAPTNTAYHLTVGTSTVSAYVLDVSTTGHLNSPITAAVAGSTVTSCGTLPTLTGNDVTGTIATGSGSPTACTLTFGKPYINAPVCLCNTNAATTCNPTSVNAAAVTFTLGITETKIYYHCFGSD